MTQKTNESDAETWHLPTELGGPIGRSAIPEGMLKPLLGMLGSVDRAHALLAHALGIGDLDAARLALRAAQIHTEIARSHMAADWTAAKTAMEDLRDLAAA